jgi:hypothetical protein
LDIVGCRCAIRGPSVGRHGIIDESTSPHRSVNVGPWVEQRRAVDAIDVVGA